MTKQIKKQLDFIEWLKKNKMYNEMESAHTMQKMMAVWEKTKGENNA